MITQQQAAALAEVLAMIRPNDWRPNQTIKVFSENWETPHPFSVIAEVAVRAANDPAIRSPSGIFLPGKHWEFETRAVAAPPAPKCQDHPEQDAHNCRCCLADVKVGDRKPEDVGKGGRRMPTPPPAGWRPTYGDPGTTSPRRNQQLQPQKPAGDDLRAENEAGRTIPHATPTKPGASE